ncbi:MAG: hypothetical protein COA52_09645 [Hyphomicrobiales bacterium]|nr:MAG: hypothetical protein COA52_09645 [Hyphomicrobiales bacterium]
MSTGALHALILSAVFAILGHIALEQTRQGKELVRVVTILEQNQSAPKTTKVKRNDRYVQTTD